MRGPDLVLHIGMQQSGATMLQRALSSLRPQLRVQGVAFVGHRRISELPHVAGWRCRADADRTQAAAFEQELADAVAHEQKQVAEVGGTAPRVVLLASDHLVGAANLDAGDDAVFRPHAVPAVAQVISALAAEHVRLVLYTHRQDRLMEYCYLRAVHNGGHHELAEQFPHRFEPVLDYSELLARLQALPQVADVRVRPFELIAAGPRPFVDDFLTAVDLRGALDLDAVADDLAPHHVYSRRGLRIALGMNPHLETARDRRLVREFLLEHFAATDDRQRRFLPKRQRHRILEAYREPNRELFRVHMPDLPADGYDDDATTARLGDVLADPGSGDDGDRHTDRHTDRRTSARGATVFTDLVAHLANRNRLLYRMKVRVLARRCDAFLVSFPKCGRTWLRMLLGIALGAHFGITVRNVRRFTDADVTHPGLPRVLATHDDSPQDKAPHQVMRDKRAYDGTRVVLLVRDPRDVIVSLYFHVTRRRRVPYDGDLMDFVRDRTGGLASLLAFYDAWAPRLAADDLLVVRYEDLHADPARELRRVLAFLRVTDVDDAVVAHAVEGASFGRLQRLEREGSAGTRALRTATPDDPESYKIRRGRVAGYADYLDARAIAVIDAAIARSSGARALGYFASRETRGGPASPDRNTTDAHRGAGQA